MSQQTFISYRTKDGTDIPFHLHNYLKSKGMDVYYDRREPSNDRPIIDKLVQKVKNSDHLVLLLTENSANGLLSYAKRHDKALDYVYEEVNAALESGCIIIPVYLHPERSLKELEQLNRQLFVDGFGCNDGYHFIRQEQNVEAERLFEEIFHCTNAKTTSQHVDMSELYWVGTRMSDVEKGIHFRGYILFFGESGHDNTMVMCSEKTGDRVDHNDSSDLSQDVFIEQSIASVLQQEPTAKFMFYNPSTVYRLGLDAKYGREHFVCLNEKAVLDDVNDKQRFRNMMRGVIPLLPAVERTRVDCNYDNLMESMREGCFEDNNDYGTEVADIRYDEEPRFIVQAPVSSGGAGTFVLSRENSRYMLSSLNPRSTYMVSVFYTNNIAVNIHILVDDKQITLLPASVQLEREVEEENKLLYKGADFPVYFEIERSLRAQFESQASSVALFLQAKGYRGVLGVDAIIHDGRVNITEVNGRFQASTELINRTLLHAGYKTLQELNYEIFRDGCLSETDRSCCQSIKVPYSNYAFSYEGTKMHFNHIYQKTMQLLKEGQQTIVSVQADGYQLDSKIKYCAQAYLFRIVFFKSIASISEEGTVWINENICEPGRWLTGKILERDKLAIKLALLIQGIRVENQIRVKLREATNNAVDISLGTKDDMMIVNAPTNIRLVEFSPFELRRSESEAEKFSIWYYDKLLLDPVGVFLEDKNQNLTVDKDGEMRHRFSEIAYLSTDRLRVHLTNACLFKLSGKGCKFCNISVEESKYPIEPEDVKTVVKQYMADRKADELAGKDVYLKHFLIGGQSLEGSDEQLIATAKVLKPYRLPIYAMTLPLRPETVEKLADCGVLEYAYNIEIFNKTCRKKYMPGKSGTSVEEYFSELDATRKILNRTKGLRQKKVVRSMVIVGLEPRQDLLEGIQKLIDLKVEPMLSVFRPLPGTPLEHLNAPPIREVYELFYTVSRMLFYASDDRSNFRKLGPECRCCQNNTVSLPWDMQVGEQVKTEWGLDPRKTAFVLGNAQK